MTKNKSPKMPKPNVDTYYGQIKYEYDVKSNTWKRISKKRNLWEKLFDIGSKYETE